MVKHLTFNFLFLKLFECSQLSASCGPHTPWLQGLRIRSWPHTLQTRSCSVSSSVPSWPRGCPRWQTCVWSDLGGEEYSLGGALEEAPRSKVKIQVNLICAENVTMSYVCLKALCVSKLRWWPGKSSLQKYCKHNLAQVKAKWKINKLHQ